MISTGLVVYPEAEFEYAKERLVECCNNLDINKLKLTKSNGTYIISCSNCHAAAIGSDILEAITNYEFGNFAIYPTQR